MSVGNLQTYEAMRSTQLWWDGCPARQAQCGTDPAHPVDPRRDGGNVVPNDTSRKSMTVHGSRATAETFPALRPANSATTIGISSVIDRVARVLPSGDSRGRARAL
jgi:hypothetical protein